MSAISGINTKGIVPQHQRSINNDKSAKATGIALAVLGVLGLLLSINVLAVGMGVGAVVLGVGISGLACSVTALVLSIVLLRKPSPVRVVQAVPVKSPEISVKSPEISLTPSTIMDKSYWEIKNAAKACSKDEIAKELTRQLTEMGIVKFFKKHEANFSSIFGDGILSANVLLKEINCKNLNELGDKLWRDVLTPKQIICEINRQLNEVEFKTFIKENGANCLFFLTQIFPEYEKRIYFELTRLTLFETFQLFTPFDKLKFNFNDYEYSVNLTKEYIECRIGREVSNKGFEEFYNEHKDPFILLLTSKKIDGMNFMDHAKEATAKQSLKEVLNRYSWQLFDFGVLRGSDFTVRAINECLNLSESEIIERYGKKIFEFKIIEPPIPLKFTDQLTSERMENPILMPPYGAGNRIDLTTLLNPNYCPQKMEKGVIYYKNPFNTLYYPASEYKIDLTLLREIQEDQERRKKTLLTLS